MLKKMSTRVCWSLMNRLQNKAYIIGNNSNGPKLYALIVTNRLHSGNAFYLSAQNLLSSRFLAKNLQLKIYTELLFCLLFCMTLKLGLSP